MSNACKTCDHWRPSSPDATVAPCREGSPQAQIDQNANQPRGTWPWTAAADDCGQWEAKGGSQAAATSAAPQVITIGG